MLTLRPVTPCKMGFPKKKKGGCIMVPKRLKEARMEAGLSQEKLSQLLGVAEGINTRSHDFKLRGRQNLNP